MRKIFLACLIFFSVSHFANAQKNFINQIIRDVSIDSLMLTVRQLSGDTIVIINNKIDSIINRYADSPDVKKAATFIEQKFKSFGLLPVEQKYSNKGYSGKNIYAYQQGTNKSTNCYIVCAHYDNLPPGAENYGSDDNASGVSAVIEAARLLSKRSLPYSIYYLLFDHEEEGLVGSDYYATMHDNADTPVLGVINMDMIAYDGNNDSVANIHISNVPQLGKNISDKLVFIDSIYQIGLKLKVYTDPAKLNSDHASFWQNYMPAVLFIEDDMTGDFNPKYHTVFDRINLFNINYYHRMVKLAVGTFAGLVSDSSHVGVNEILPQKNTAVVIAPNPANDKFNITITDENAKPSIIKLSTISGIELLNYHVSENEKNSRSITVSTTYFLNNFFYLTIKFEDESFAIKKILIEK